MKIKNTNQLENLIPDVRNLKFQQLSEISHRILFQYALILLFLRIFNLNLLRNALKNWQQSNLLCHKSTINHKGIDMNLK